MAEENYCEDGEIPLTCVQCGSVFAWHLEDEDLTDRCPACRTETPQTDDDAGV